MGCTTLGCAASRRGHPGVPADRQRYATRLGVRLFERRGSMSHSYEKLGREHNGLHQILLLHVSLDLRVKDIEALLSWWAEHKGQAQLCREVSLASAAHILSRLHCELLEFESDPDYNAVHVAANMTHRWKLDLTSDLCEALELVYAEVCTEAALQRSTFPNSIWFTFDKQWKLTAPGFNTQHVFWRTELGRALASRPT